MRSVAMFGRARLHDVGSSHAFLHGAVNSHFNNISSFFYILKSVRRVLTPSPETTLCSLVIMIKKMDDPLNTVEKFHFHSSRLFWKYLQI
jgi:hypothetical protein